MMSYPGYTGCAVDEHASDFEAFVSEMLLFLMSAVLWSKNWWMFSKLASRRG
jgi:hypothetical protein